MVLIQVRSIVCSTGELGETVAMLIENQNPFAASLRRSTLLPNKSKVAGSLVRSHLLHSIRLG